MIVNALKDQRDKFYLIELSLNDSLVYGLDSEKDTNYKECLRIIIPKGQENIYTRNKGFFKCSSTYNTIITTVNPINIEYSINIFT